MVVIGLTGSIGMGKSTVAAMFERHGIPAHDSDTAAHNAMAGQARYAVAAEFPYYEYPQLYDRKTKKIIRRELGKIVFADPEKREKLEAILHPLVRAAQNEFIRKCGRLGLETVVLDIPLLFETGSDKTLDYTVVASAPYHIQKTRVLDRPGMTEEKFHAILARQMPDGEKCTCADFVVQTGLGRATSMRQVKDILQAIEKTEQKTYA